MGHGPRPHLLGRLVLEPAVRTPARAPALWDRLGRLGAGPLAQAIDELCSGLVDPAQVIQLDRLEIDAGRVREDHLEEDLIEGTRRALMEALLALLPLLGRGARPADQAATPAPLTPGGRLAESVRHLLAHGALPWWHAAADPDRLDELLRAARAQSADETRRALIRAGQDPRARRRLALQLSTEALHELVRLIDAGQAEFVIDYVAALERRQAQAPFVPATTPDFRVATWELVLAYLLVERGSQFNRKRFVSDTIAGMARHFGLDHGALLFELRRALPRLTRAAEPLRTILDELWAEQAAAEAPSREPAARAAAARRDAHLARLSALLGRGLPPAEAGPAFDEAFRALQQEPGQLRYVLLAHWHRARVRERLAARPDGLLTELVHVVVPAHAAEVVSYGRALERAHATRPVLGSDAASFRRARWRFFLDTLVLQHGSSFNTRAFIRATLERLAAHHNTSYEALVPWLWRELGDLPRPVAGAHPVVMHLGALYRELRARRGEPARGERGDARRRAPGEGAPTRRADRAAPSLFDLLPPDQRTLARAVVRFVETLPELATAGFGRGLGAGAIAVRVQRLALELLRARRGRPLRPAELLDRLIEQVARASGVPGARVLRWALRRTAPRGSARDEVRRLVAQVARASGIAPVPAPGSPAEPGAGASDGDDPVRALAGLLLRGPLDARPGPGDRAVLAWIDRIEREGTGQVRSRLVELLRDASARRRVLAAAGNAALTRLWAWRRPDQRAAVEEAVEVIEELERVLGSSRHGRALREAFWQLLWTGRASRARRGAALVALFLERLGRREPRLLALIRSRQAGDRIVARALAGLARPDSVRPRDARKEPAAPQGKPPPPARQDAEEGGVREWLVRTAGIVLVWSLLQRYFERLGLVERGAFRDVASQERACGLVHFLASGQTECREPDLVLAKVLCGLDVEAPVPVRVEVDEATRTVSESLLAFLLASWKGIGGTTVQGLRGSFLCRDGRLHHGDGGGNGDGEGRWTLDVEHRTYDVLLGTFPWQVSVVKLPWMPRPLFVHWR
jgi:quinol monooxygenase YgiN